MPGFEKLWFNRVSALEFETEQIVSKALRAAGWQHTSSTPGSYWMWQGEIKGIRYMLGAADAARIQEHFDREAYFKQFPDELGD